jgi:hypothetical protein
VNKIKNLATFKGDYTFVIKVTLESFPTHVVYEYYSLPAETFRQDELKFSLRDFCLDVQYTNSELVIADLHSIFAYRNKPGDLMIEKQILTEPTKFFLTYPTYSTQEEGASYTGVKDPCGKLIYTTLPVSKTGFENIIT